MMAADRGHLCVVDLLIEHDAWVDMKDQAGKNLTEYLQPYRFQVEVLVLVIQKDWTALMLTASNYQASLVARLSSHGAKVDAQNMVSVQYIVRSNIFMCARRVSLWIERTDDCIL